MKYSIEPMNVDDAERCAELERALFAGDGPWSAQAFVSELAGAHNHYFVAREPDGHVLGYAGVALLGASPNMEAEVHTIGTDPSAQRLGIGGALLDALLTLADSRQCPVFLEVRTDNEPAIALVPARRIRDRRNTKEVLPAQWGRCVHDETPAVLGVREIEEQQA